MKEMSPWDGMRGGRRVAEETEYLNELGRRLMQVGIASGEVRKPRCRRRHNWRFRG